MGFIWFWLVAVMLVAYVLFDGFDLGVGILHPFLARREEERQLMLRFQIIGKRERQTLEHASGPIEFGRGPQRENIARCVVPVSVTAMDRTRPLTDSPDI